MEKQKSIKLNFIMNSILTVSLFVFPLITFPYISRTLLAEGIGKVSFATSIASYFLMIAQLGIPTYGIRACAQVRDNKEELSRTAHEIFIINLVMSVISYIVFAIVLFMVPKFAEDKLLYIITSLIIVFNTLGMEWLYKALEQYSYITIRSIIIKLVALVAMFFLVTNPDDYRVYAGITVFASSASSVLNFYRVRKYIWMHSVGHYYLNRHIKSIAIFFAMSCATTIYTNIDSIMLGFMTSDAAVGFYDTSIKIKNILANVVSSLGVVILPRVSYYIKNNMESEFKSITKRAINFVFLVACPLIIYFGHFSQECIYFLAGETFSNSIPSMRIIMPTLLFIGLTNIIGIQILVPLGKEKQVLYSEIVGAVVDLVFNLLLIPYFGIAGAAIGTLLAEISVFLIQLISSWKIVSQSFKEVSYIKIAVACIVSILFANLISIFNFGNFVTLLISAICFFSMYGIILTVMRESMIIEYVTMYLVKIKRIVKK